MPLRITIESVPGGDERKAEVLGVVTVTQRGATTLLDSTDAGGERFYQATLDGRHGEFTHHRRDGWLRCVALALHVLDRRSVT